jgi:hypothetical protein
MFNANLHQNSNEIHHRNRKINPKIHLETQTLSKRSNTGVSITIPDFELYYRAIAIKTAWYWHKSRYEDQWNIIEDQDMNPCSYTYLIFGKDTKNILWRKDTFLNKCCWGNQISACRKLKVDAYLSLCTSINSQWIEDLNIRPETLKIVQERAENTLELIGIGNDFCNRIQKVQQLRENIDKWDIMKSKPFAQ